MRTVAPQSIRLRRAFRFEQAPQAFSEGATKQKYCDCKGAVDIFQNIINGQGYDPKSTPNTDLWQVITNIVNLQPQDHFLIQWIPSHLDDPKKLKKLTEYSNEGGQQEDIDGNIGADKIAADSAAAGLPDAKRCRLAFKRAELAEEAQNMYVHIWTTYREDNKNWN